MRLCRQLFVTDKIQYCGQAIGLVVADSTEIARQAAALVIVEYEDVQRPILTIKEALASGQEVKPDVMMQLEMNTGEKVDGEYGGFGMSDDSVMKQS